MRKEDVRWEVEVERRRMEDQDERLWQEDRMIDDEVEAARGREEEWSVEKWTREERRREQAMQMTEGLQEIRRRQEEERQEEKEKEVDVVVVVEWSRWWW